MSQINQIIAISKFPIGGHGVDTVNARSLHEALELAKDFSDWIKAQLADFIKGADYEVFPVQGEYGRPRTEYVLTIDCAKSIAMMSRTDKGREVRAYFIECERVANQVRPSLPDFANPAAAARAWADEVEKKQSLQLELDAAKPKIEFAEAVRNVDGVCSIEQIAKTLGYGRNRFFAKLRDDGILLVSNLPAQRYIDNGCLTVVESKPWTDSSGISHPCFSVRVTGKGQVWLTGRYAIRKEAA